MKFHIHNWMKVLKIIRDNNFNDKRLSMEKMAQKLQITPSNFFSWKKELEIKGYLISQHGQGKRTLNHTLTTKGYRLVNGIDIIFSEVGENGDKEI